MMQSKRAVIIGAGPAGLTAAYELLTRTDIVPVILEKSEYMGGISRTINHNGNRMDIGGHRFFSKSDRVMNWWLNVLPLQRLNGNQASINYHRRETVVTGSPEGPDPAVTDRVMLVRSRRSRIYYLRRFFEYPITLSKNTLANLGARRTLRIGLSYLWSKLAPVTPERSLEDFFINRFGRELYTTFFKSYTEKVWGVPCKEISAEWGKQRIKSLSVSKTLLHAVRKKSNGRPAEDIRQKGTETSLIEQFLYPKFGPGQMWEEVAARVREMGGEILTNCTAKRVLIGNQRVIAVEAVNQKTGEILRFEGDFFFSTAPIKDLLRSFDVSPPANVLAVSDGLVYRDFITVGLLLRRLKISDESERGRNLIADNWIYIQEPDVLLGRLQVFNNWSPHMVADPDTVWLGLEYFCNESDAIWNLPDNEMIALAEMELAKIGIIDPGDILDATVVRMEKTYPAYLGTYNRFPEIREYIDGFENLFLIGRNGMHRYNNQDHSMLTAMQAVDCILAGVTSKESLWNVNTEEEYHEERES